MNVSPLSFTHFSLSFLSQPTIRLNLCFDSLLYQEYYIASSYNLIYCLYHRTACLNMSSESSRSQPIRANMGARITRSRPLPTGANTLRTRRLQATGFVRRLQQYDDMLAQVDNGLERRRNLFRNLLQRIMVAQGVLEEVSDESESEADSMDIDPDDDEDEDDGAEDGEGDDEAEDDEEEEEDDDDDEDDDDGDGVEYISVGSAPVHLPTAVPIIAAAAVNTVQQPAHIHPPPIIARGSNANFDAQLPTPPPSPQLPVQQLPSPPPTPPAAPIEAQQQRVCRLRGGRAAPEHHNEDRENLEELYREFGQRRSRRNRRRERKEEFSREMDRIDERRRAMGGSYTLQYLGESRAAIERLLEAETGQGGSSVVAERELRNLLDRVVNTIRMERARLALKEARLAAAESGRSREEQ